MRKIHGGGTVKLYTVSDCGVHMGFDGKLGAHGLHGHRPLRCIYRVRSTAESQGVHAPPHRTPHIRRLLGVLLILHILDKCDGQGRNSSC